MNLTKSIRTVIKQIQKLEADYTQLGNSAALHFREVANNLQKLADKPESTFVKAQHYNLSELKNEAANICESAGLSLTEFEILFGNGALETLVVTTKFKRYFPSKDTYDRDYSTVFRKPIEQCLEALKEAIQKHREEALEKGIDLESRANNPVLANKAVEKQS
mgnify:CR=1 FL=1